MVLPFAVVIEIFILSIQKPIYYTLAIIFVLAFLLPSERKMYIIKKSLAILAGFIVLYLVYYFLHGSIYVDNLIKLFFSFVVSFSTLLAYSPEEIGSSIERLFTRFRLLKTKRFIIESIEYAVFFTQRFVLLKLKDWKDLPVHIEKAVKNAEIKIRKQTYTYKNPLPIILNIILICIALVSI